MSLVGGWLLAPLALMVACCGVGLLAEKATGTKLPGALVPGVGLAGLIVLAGIPALWDATAELAVPLVALAAACGMVVGRPWAGDRLRAAWPWAAACAAGTYAIYAAPSLLSGQGSIAGYLSLDDSGLWLGLLDHVLSHGRDIHVPPSSYELTLSGWLGGGYPVGAFLPLGVAAALSGQDPAAAYQPVIALYAAILGLGLYACARPLVHSRAIAASAALVAVQASLFLGYAQWGGIKEVCAAALLPVMAWLAVGPPRRLPLLAITVGALCGTLGVQGLVWGGPAFALGGLFALRGHPRLDRRLATRVGAVGALLALAMLPALATVDFAEQALASQGGLRGDELGNLVRPLPLIQGAGIWPAGDFRVDPEPIALVRLLAPAVAACAIVSIVLAVRRRRWELPALLTVAVVGAVPAIAAGSPWVDAKALAVLSPMPLFGAAVLAGLGLRARGSATRAAASAVGAALVLACVWSTLAVGRDVQIAPRASLAELRDLGRAVAGRGPVLQLDFDVYGDRDFLSRSAPDGATDLRVGPVRRRDGGTFPHLTTADVDQVLTADLWRYPILVRRRSPVASRPPAAYHRIWAGTYWEAWERRAAAPPPVRRLPLGTTLGTVGRARCDAIRTLSKLPGVTTLAAAPRSRPIVIDLARAAVPPAWRMGDGVYPVIDGTAVAAVSVPRPGLWRIWVGGSTRGTLEVTVDGHAAGELRHQIAHAGQWLRFNARRLTAGRHTVALRYRRGSIWDTGRGRPDGQAPLGPLALTPGTADAASPVISVPGGDYRRLCDGRTYDWIEAGRSG